MATPSTEAIQAFWEKFREKNQLLESTPYTSWSFGNTKTMADELLALVIAGKKQATASYYDSYIASSETLPEKGTYSVLLDGDNTPRAVILTQHVEMIPFKQVSQAHAFLEGEGDRTLDYWQEHHQKFFSAEARSYGLKFYDTSLVVFEIFTCVYVD